MSIHAVCFGCGYKVPIKIGETFFEMPPSWFRISVRIREIECAKSKVWFCSSRCVFDAKARGYTFPRPVIERQIVTINGDDGDYVFLSFALPF